MTGTVCLQGGAEFGPDCREMDAALLRDAGGPVVVTALAGAVGREYDTAGRHGVEHFRALGASDAVSAPDVRVDPEGALEVLRRARLLVLPGGSPARLLQALTGTPVGDVVRALLDDGGTVSGSSAGAMVLCGATVLPEGDAGVVPGLGVLPDLAVVPHWTGQRAGWTRALLAALPPYGLVLGLPEQSGVVVRDGVLTAVGSAPTALVREGELLEVGQSRAVRP